MYTKLFWWMFFAGRFSAFWIAAGIVFIIGFSIYFAIRWVLAWEDANQGKEEREVNRKWSRRLIGVIGLYAALILSMCVLPSRRDVLTIAALKSVDQYNASVAESNLTPGSVISTADHLVGTAEDVLGVIDSAIAKAKAAIGQD